MEDPVHRENPVEGERGREKGRWKGKSRGGKKGRWDWGKWNGMKDGKGKKDKTKYQEKEDKCP